MSRLIITSFLIVVFAGAAQASGRFGVGVIAGEPTGFSAIAFPSSNEAVDAAVGWAFNEDQALHIHGDYLRYNTSLLKMNKGKMALYYGIGARGKFVDEDTVFGARVPLGVSYMFQNAPANVFFEFVPIMDFTPDTDFTASFAFGVRYLLGTHAR
jgi:hypothetical protein